MFVKTLIPPTRVCIAPGTSIVVMVKFPPLEGASATPRNAVLVGAVARLVRVPLIVAL
jgi:hypothetical protein